MTLSALITDLTGLRLHGLTETNVAGVEAGPSGVILDGYDRDADKMDDLREENAAFAADLKQAEAERDEWERRCLALESHADDMRERGELGNVVFDLRQDLHRIDDKAREMAKALASAQAELSALRKRKGVEVGVCAHSREIWTLLCWVGQTEGRYKIDAKALADKIGSAF